MFQVGSDKKVPKLVSFVFLYDFRLASCIPADKNIKMACAYQNDNLFVFAFRKSHKIKNSFHVIVFRCVYIYACENRPKKKKTTTKHTETVKKRHNRHFYDHQPSLFCLYFVFFQLENDSFDQVSLIYMLRTE